MRPPCKPFYAKKVHICKEDLKKWIRNVFGHVDMELPKTHSFISSLQATNLLEHEEKQLMNATVDYEELLKRLKMMWCQKSKINWLKYGDRNTSFFHVATISR